VLASNTESAQRLGQTPERAQVGIQPVVSQPVPDFYADPESSTLSANDNRPHANLGVA
jgi:hypothetical protein